MCFTALARQFQVDDFLQDSPAVLSSRVAGTPGAQLLLIGVQLPPNYGPRYTEKFQAIYQELAREYGVALLPSLVAGIGTEQKLMQQDGIHPNATAQPLIRDRVWEALVPLLDQAARSQPAPPG